MFYQIQGSAKEWLLGSVIPVSWPPLAARARFTQPRDPSLADPCIAPRRNGPFLQMRNVPYLIMSFAFCIADAISSQLNSVRLKLEQRRRRIEEEKRKMEQIMARQREKVGLEWTVRGDGCCLYPTG